MMLSVSTVPARAQQTPALFRPTSRQWRDASAVGFVLVVLGLMFPGVAGAIPASERAALIALYNSANGAGWTRQDGWRNADNTDFGAPGTECDWFGVDCGQISPNVRRISLPLNNLVGTLPPLGAFTELEIFVVSRNQLSGTIPSLAGLDALVSFAVDRNQLSGPIPPLGQSVQLQALGFNDNLLTGAIPSLDGLTRLRVFNAERNQLSGSIPSLDGLGALTQLRVNNNRLAGAMPAAPNPNNLTPRLSVLCPNGLAQTPDPVWDAATGTVPWFRDCVALIAQSLTFGTPPVLRLGGTGTVSASSQPTPGSTAPIRFTSQTSSRCSVDAATGLVTVLPAATAGSTCIVAANKAGDATHAPAPQVSQSIVIESVADLALTAVATPAPVLAGNVLTYRLTGANRGPGPAFNVRVRFTPDPRTRFESLSVPPGVTCATPPIGAHGPIDCATPPALAVPIGDVIVDIAMRVEPTAVGVIAASAVASSSTFDPSTGDLTAEVATAVTPLTHVVSASVMPAGAGSVSCSSPVGHGNVSTCTATAASGFRLLRIEGCGASSTSSPLVTAPVVAPCAVRAEFGAIVNGTCGSATGVLGTSAPTVNLCASGTASAVASGVAAFTWTCAGLNSGASATCSAPRGYTVEAIRVRGSGLVTPQGPQLVMAGQAATFTVQPDIGSVIETIDSTCGGTLAGDQFTTPPVIAACRVNVAFAFAAVPIPGPGLIALLLLVAAIAFSGSRRARPRALDAGRSSQPRVRTRRSVR